MPSRNCKSRPIGWRIANNDMLAEAVKEGGWIVAWFHVNIIASADNLGRMEGGKYQLRDMFFPHQDIIPDEVDKIIGILDRKGLILSYIVRGLRYIQLPRIGNWSELRGGMSDYSDFPPPPEEVIKNWAIRFNDVYMPCERHKDNVCPEGKGKGKGKGYIKLAEFVSMTKEEKKKLIDKYGEKLASRSIEILDNYKGSSGKKYKSDYRAILSWVIDKVQQENKPTRCGECGGIGIVKEGSHKRYCECEKGRQRKEKDANTLRR